MLSTRSTYVAEPTHLIVLLGSKWAELESVPTRWHQVIRRWATSPAVTGVTVVDFPRFRPAAPLLARHDSWLAGVDALSISVPSWRRRPVPGEALAWRAAARAIERVAAIQETAVVVVAATPLWAPVLPRLSSRIRTAFDGYDDWRALPSVAAVTPRVTAGYRAAGAADVVTFGSPVLAARLTADFGLRGTVVRNGADVPAFAAGGPGPAGLPSQPFAVYVGVVQERVDIDLLRRTAAVLPTVVAGPVAPSVRAGLEACGVICLGSVEPRLVPGLLARAAVGLLPHVVDDLTTSMDPIKVYEYRAAGLPVVAAAGVVERSPGVITIVNPAEWAAAVRAAADGGRVIAGPVRDWDDVAVELLGAYNPAAAYDEVTG